MTARGKPSFTFGIEEEYFLVDPRTRALVSEPPRSLLDECKAKLGGHVAWSRLKTFIDTLPVAKEKLMQAA